MKITRTASGTTIKLSKTEWEDIGREAGWLNDKMTKEALADAATLSKDFAEQTSDVLHVIDSIVTQIAHNTKGITHAAKTYMLGKLKGSVQFLESFKNAVERHPHAQMPPNNLNQSIEDLYSAISNQDLEAARQSAAQTRSNLLSVIAYVNHLEKIL